MSDLPPGLTQTTPLAEAQANSLEELFSRDPLDLADKDIDQIIEVLRAQRIKWNQAQADAKPRGKPKMSMAAVAELSFDDFGL